MYRRMINKLVYLYRGIQFSNKEQTIGIPNNMNESHRYNTELKKPDTKEYILYYSIYIKFWNRQN